MKHKIAKALCIEACQGGKKVVKGQQKETGSNGVWYEIFLKKRYPRSYKSGS